MTNGDKTGNLQSKYEFNSTWADRIARLIIVGLVVDIVAAFILGKSWLEIALNIIANLLIIAGVWGELRFSRRAKEASDAIVARAQIAAAEAQLELAKFRTPRAALLTSEVLMSITERLKPFAGTQFDCGIGSNGEQADFWWVLQPAIVAAGWQHLIWQYPPGSLPMLIIQGPNRAGSGNVGAANVEIHLHPDNREKLWLAAMALVGALNEVGIAAREAGFNAHSTNNAAVHILIGPKG